MSRKRKIDPVLKVKLVERYLSGELSKTEAVRLACVDPWGAFLYSCIKISPAVCTTGDTELLIFHCPLDGQHTTVFVYFLFYGGFHVHFSNLAFIHEFFKSTRKTVMHLLPNKPFNVKHHLFFLLLELKYILIIHVVSPR